MKILILFFALACASGFVNAELEQITGETKLTEVIEDLSDEILEFLPKEERELFYQDYYDSYGLLDGLNVMSLLSMLSKPQADNATCQMCNKVMGLGRSFLTSKEIIVGLLGGVCKDSNTFSKRACEGVLERMADPVIWLFKNTKLTNPEICSVLTGHGCMKFLDVHDNKTIFWELPLPPKKEFKPAPVAAGKPKKVLHLTDIHLDLWYEKGSHASCNEPLCCRVHSEDHKNRSILAGAWAQVAGDCDIPQHFVIDSLKQIAARHPDLDAVFWTGDNVPHDVWNTTQQINLRHIHTVSGIISVAFNHVPVFPVLGNHEVHPINMYIPQAVIQKDGNWSNKWLYETLVKDYWAKWLDSQEIQRTFLQGGFYSKMFTPQWKIIVLNSNIAQKDNFWILYDPVDPDGQLAWLIKELDHAETIGAHVSILGHVPPKHENYDAWVHNYIRIMDRYSHVITGSYYGHTHKDEIVVLYNQAKKPVHVSYISGSLTTYSDLNPQYVVFEMDSRGMPLDSSVYLTDLDLANQHLAKNASSHPEWRLEYHPKRSYRLTDMSPASWDNFIKEAETDLDLAFLYANHFHRYTKEYAEGHVMNITKVQQMMQHLRRYSPFMNMEKDNDSDNDE